MDAMGAVREGETQTGLRLDLKWLLAVLSSTLIWGCGHVPSCDLWPN